MNQAYFLISIILILSSTNIGFARSSSVSVGNNTSVEAQIFSDPPQTKTKKKQKKRKLKKLKRINKDDELLGVLFAMLVGLMVGGFRFFFAGAASAPNGSWILGLVSLLVGLVAISLIIIAEEGGPEKVIKNPALWLIFVAPFAIMGLVCIIIGLLRLSIGWWIGGIVFLIPLAIFLLIYLIDQIGKAMQTS